MKDIAESNIQPNNLSEAKIVTSKSENSDTMIDPAIVLLRKSTPKRQTITPLINLDEWRYYTTSSLWELFSFSHFG